jgi:amidophosphoribosyltransferase
MLDAFHEECGVVGVYGHPEAANIVYLALYSLQHRGQESAGIVSSNGEVLISHRGMGLVADIFREDIIRRLEGPSAIGHNRYSTSGASHLKNAQPFSVDYSRGAVALSHNGNLVNAVELRRKLESEGRIFQSSSDSEVVLHLIAMSKQPRLVDRVIEALHWVKGAYSMVFLSEDEMVAARDPYGFRPLVLGRLPARDDGCESWIAASETCALDLVDASYVREIEPGEVVEFGPTGMRSFHPFSAVPQARCVFEYVYFARPDSLLYGRNVYQVRKEMGRRLAQEHPVEGDIVIPVPDSGVPAAVGYSEESGIPFEMGLIRNHYVGRTFIEPQDSIRHFGVRVKLNAQREVLAGKRVIVIDDSIVRGTTSRKIVTMLRNAGALEVHLRISSPPTTGPCFYGVDTPTHKELIASSHSTEEIRDFIGADSLGYLSEEGLYGFLRGKPNEGYCDACFTGRYPVLASDEEKQPRQLHLFEAGDR